MDYDKIWYKKLKSQAKIDYKMFRKIDKDNSGVLDINDIKDSYNAGKHPDVLSGKKT